MSSLSSLSSPREKTYPKRLLFSSMIILHSQHLQVISNHDTSLREYSHLWILAPRRLGRFQGADKSMIPVRRLAWWERAVFQRRLVMHFVYVQSLQIISLYRFRFGWNLPKRLQPLTKITSPSIKFKAIQLTCRALDTKKTHSTIMQVVVIWTLTKSAGLLFPC